MSRSTRFCPSHEDLSPHLYELFTASCPVSLHVFCYRIATDYTDNFLLPCFCPQNFSSLPITPIPSMHIGLVITNTALPHSYPYQPIDLVVDHAGSSRPVTRHCQTLMFVPCHTRGHTLNPASAPQNARACRLRRCSHQCSSRSHSLQGVRL